MKYVNGKKVKLSARQKEKIRAIERLAGSIRVDKEMSQRITERQNGYEFIRRHV